MSIMSQTGKGLCLLFCSFSLLNSADVELFACEQDVVEMPGLLKLEEFNDISRVLAHHSAIQWITKGEQLLNEKKFQDAFIAFKQAARLDENNAQALYYLGRCHFYGYGAQKSTQHAQCCLDVAVALDPTNKQAKHLLAQMNAQAQEAEIKRKKPASRGFAKR